MEKKQKEDFFSVKTFYLYSCSTVNKIWPYEILQIVASCFYLNSTQRANFLGI